MNYLTLVILTVWLISCKNERGKKEFSELKDSKIKSFTSVDSLVKYAIPNQKIEVIKLDNNDYEDYFFSKGDTVFVDNIIGWTGDDSIPRAQIRFKKQTSLISFRSVHESNEENEVGMSISNVYLIKTTSGKQYIAITLSNLHAMGTSAKYTYVGIINTKEIGKKEIVLFEDEHTSSKNFVDYGSNGTLEFLKIELTNTNIYNIMCNKDTLRENYRMSIYSFNAKSPNGLSLIQNNTDYSMYFDFVVLFDSLYIPTNSRNWAIK